MKRFVNGFMFTPFWERVLLIRKEHPKWQKGLLNGIGGKIEEGETPHEAMVREFQEETTIETVPKDWEHVLTICNAHFEVFFYRANSEKVLEWEEAGGPSPTEEHVSVWDIDDIQDIQVIPNLRWLVPMLRDPDLKTPFVIPYL